MLGKEAPKDAPGSPGGRWGVRLRRLPYLLGLLAGLAALGFALKGKDALPLVAGAIKFIGLGGAYGLVALLALALLYLPLRLWLRYRLQKQAMEYQYLLTLAERHGVVVVDPKRYPELAAELEAKKNLAAPTVTLLAARIFLKIPAPINRTCEIFPLQPVPFWGMN